MMLEATNLPLLREALEHMKRGFDHLPDFEPRTDTDALRNVLLEVAERMRDNLPYFHPLYIGQMHRPPHPVSRLAYALSMWINPNNHAFEGGRASSAMEKEAVAEIASMFGWRTHMGHLTGGGTMANLEALWVSRRLKPGGKLVASQQAHYTHERISEVLGVPFRAVPCDGRARMDVGALEALLQSGEVGTVVATIGTTATGAVDPLPEILRLRSRYGFRVHADAAYGGYFVLADGLSTETRPVFDCLGEADSIAIDPHKHGLQPFGCGCILFSDPSVGALYKHDSPYTYFSSDELHFGEISLECSRPGAAAVALWATQRLMPLVRGGEFTAGLDKCRHAALTLHGRLAEDPRFMTAFEPELDILIWALRAHSASAVSQLSNDLFSKAAAENLHLAIVNLPAAIMRHSWHDIDWDQDQVTCLRSCLVKPEHLEWADRIWLALDRATNRVRLPL